jgi:shikimate 5-dehydrogenase
VADYADVAEGRVSGEVLMNSTSIGMSPGDGESPVSAGALGGYRLVFDAVYTPQETRLLKVLFASTSQVPLVHACAPCCTQILCACLTAT